jgi:hypothetical protein
VNGELRLEGLNDLPAVDQFVALHSAEDGEDALRGRGGQGFLRVASKLWRSMRSM